MNKRKNDNLYQYLLNTNEFKIYISLKKKLEDYINLLNLLFNEKNIKYSIIIIKASEKSIKETLENIRQTDIFFKIPYKKNFYILILQNTDSKAAIEFGSRLTSLINRIFMLNKKNISHKLALISFKSKPIKIEKLCYEIVSILRDFKNTQTENYWVEIKRL